MPATEFDDDTDDEVYDGEPEIESTSDSSASKAVRSLTQTECPPSSYL